MLTNKKAVIFDLDGTLVDSMWIWQVIDQRFLSKYNIDVPEGINDELEGFSFYETALYFKDRFPLPLSIEEIMNTWNQMAGEMYANKITLKEGAREFISYLYDHKIPMGIATSNSRELTKVCLEANGIGNAFANICSSDEVNKGKPEPDVYLKAASNLGVAPEDALIFEDIVYGLMAGKAANMTACAVEDSYSLGQKEEKRRIADYYIQTYFDVLNGTYEKL